LRSSIVDISSGLAWKPVAAFRSTWPRQLSVINRLSARLFRGGFHALAVLSTGGIVAAVAGSIVTLSAGDNEFRATHTIARGTRPLHITGVPGGTVYWGEYFDNAARDEVHIYASSDAGATWAIAYTFPRGAIRHVHNIVHDPWEDCLWVLTGDYGDECCILRASCDFSRIETVLQGNQQARAVALVPMPDGSISLPTHRSNRTMSTASTASGSCRGSLPSAVRPFTAAASETRYSFPPWWNRAR
jgi:hypothetical protein